MASRTSSVLGAVALLVLALLSTAVNFTEPRKPFVSLAPIRLEETSARLLSGPTAAAQPKTASPVPARYRLDPSQSKFIAHALAGGLLSFKGHDHLVAVRDFSGEARLDPNSIPASSLEIIAKTASMEETSSVFTEAQKKIINKELHDIVLLPDQYPDIVFRSTSVTGQSISNGQYDLKIAGNLTLNGTTRSITIPTKLTATGNEIRAQGEFSVSRSDFKVKATSAVHGLVRVRDKIKFTFDIVGHQF